MDTNIVVSIVSASSAVVVAIAALVVNAVWIGKGFGLVIKRIERLEAGLDRLTTAVEMLTGSMHDIAKRLSVLNGVVATSNRKPPLRSSSVHYQPENEWLGALDVPSVSGLRPIRNWENSLG